MEASRVAARALALRCDGECAPVPHPALGVNRLFIGSIGAASNRAGLERAGITHVVSVGAETSFEEQIVCLKIDVKDRAQDGEKIRQAFEVAIAFIDQALKTHESHRVLVHCFQGKSRSSTIVAAYLMSKLGCSLEDALACIRTNRPQAQPNIGFGAQLRRFGKQLRAAEEDSVKVQDK